MEQIERHSIVIVGAGPAGLAVAGRLREAGLDFKILEQSQKVGFMWHCHYDRLCLHTVKELSHLPHLPFPDDYPRYVTRDQLCNYFDDYAKNFSIEPEFGVEVRSITKVEGGLWELASDTDKKWHAQHVIVCVGLNRIPRVPIWEGQEEFAGSIIHSREYKNPNPYLGQKVLVVGMGNTGAEIALDLAEHDIDVTVSVRSPVNIVPRDINGRPTQLTARALAKLPLGLGDWLGNQVRRFVIGDLSKYGLKTKKISPAAQLRETGMTPVIDLGTVPMIKSGKIKILPDLWGFRDGKVYFAEGREGEFDAIILATGYEAQLKNIIPNLDGFLDKHQLPQGPVGNDELVGIYFVGFDNYKLGGLLGTINTDSKTVTDHLVASLSVA